jgi:hypothetical protein
VKTPAKVLLTERAIDARNCLSMVAMTPKVLLDDRIVAHIRNRLCGFLEELRENGHATSPGDARRFLTDLAKEIDMPRTRLFRPATRSHRSDRLADVVRDCIATEFPAQRETTVRRKSRP